MLELIQSYKKIAWYSKPWLLRALWIFTTGIVLGGITGSLTPELLTPIFKSLSDEFGSDPGLTPAFAKGIFIQNITVSAFAALGGVIIGILPFLVLLINGFLLSSIKQITSISLPSRLLFMLLIKCLIVSRFCKANCIKLMKACRTLRLLKSTVL
jgi:uncharacterized membrane protein SpoIIM required for sporulation